MHTGDLAVMDDAGYLNIAGRIKDMVIRGGENVYPREVEEFLLRPPGDRGCPGDRGARCQVRRGTLCLGEAPPRRRPQPGGSAGVLPGKIAHYKIPRYLRISEGFPMTVTGKVQKFKMREVTIIELGLGDAAGVETA